MQTNQNKREGFTVTKDGVSYVGDPPTLRPAGRAVTNAAGIHPTEFKVLIEPKPVDQKIGNILLPDATRESEKFKQIEGRIVAASPLAFSYESQSVWEAIGAQKPQPGDRVLYAKYAGIHLKGRDGKDYLLVNDKDICATLDEE